MPLMRTAFTATTFQPTKKRIIAKVPPKQLGYFLAGALDAQADRLAWLKVAGVPAPVVALLMKPAIRKAACEAYVPLDLIARGQYDALQRCARKRSWFACCG